MVMSSPSYTSVGLFLIVETVLNHAGLLAHGFQDADCTAGRGGVRVSCWQGARLRLESRCIAMFPGTRYAQPQRQPTRRAVAPAVFRCARTRNCRGSDRHAGSPPQLRTLSAGGRYMTELRREQEPLLPRRNRRDRLTIANDVLIVIGRRRSGGSTDGYCAGVEWLVLVAEFLTIAHPGGFR